MKRPARVVDLSQPLGPGTVLWPGSTSVRAEVISEIDPDGSYARMLRLPEHAGTHLDAPAHFAPDGERTDAIPAEALVVPAAVLDLCEACASDRDYALDAKVIEELESRHGAIQPGSAALVATGWDRWRHDPDRYLGGSEEGDLSFPGLAPSGAELLLERGVVGIGIDTVSVDAGRASDFPVHHITLPAGVWHLEGLVNLAELPSRGALLVVGALPLVGGSGAPARVLALLASED